MSQALITTVPFAQQNRLPLELLESTGISYQINPLGRRLAEHELADLIGDTEVLIAGTEPISKHVLSRAPKLKLISRVGIGLDNVDLIEARRRGIEVCYTPDAPAPAVAELAFGLILSLLRLVHVANLEMHSGKWHRHMGRRLAEVTVGIIGTGRIGTRVLRRIPSFGTPRVLVNDLKPDLKMVPELKLEWVDKEEIYRSADVISLHVPLTTQTHNMIGRVQLLKMKRDALLINTSRGGIVNEVELAQVMKTGHLGGAAIDVFSQEPYAGELATIERCLLTSHMGSMSVDCRSRMEIEATEEVVRFFSGQPLRSPVPADEYDVLTR
jgi:D-3-phosphoglycerate dehydrogenase / 2-oxoglutarate reductase